MKRALPIKEGVPKDKRKSPVLFSVRDEEALERTDVRKRALRTSKLPPKAAELRKKRCMKYVFDHDSEW